MPNFGTLRQFLNFPPLSPQICDSAGGRGSPTFLLLIFLLLRSLCKPYDNPFCDFSNGGANNNNKKRLIPKIVVYLSCFAGRTHFAQANNWAYQARPVRLLIVLIWDKRKTQEGFHQIKLSCCQAWPSWVTWPLVVTIVTVPVNTPLCYSSGFLQNRNVNTAFARLVTRSYNLRCLPIYS